MTATDHRKGISIKRDDMRQPQHRNRARARSRRQPNPANKVYESNGPDVKVRGTPQQIADKYAQLGRDALSSGDMVKAENYFQHAEHYLRIIAAAQEQIQQRRAQQEQRRQEAATRRKGNGGETTDQPDVAAAVEPVDKAQVVVLPTEAASGEEAGNGGNGDNAGNGATVEAQAVATAQEQPQPAWDDAPPEFLTRPVEMPLDTQADVAGATDVADASEAAAAEQPAPAADDDAATPRKTVRRRRTTRTSRARKGNGANGEAAGSD